MLPNNLTRPVARNMARGPGQHPRKIPASEGIENVRISHKFEWFGPGICMRLCAFLTSKKQRVLRKSQFRRESKSWDYSHKLDLLWPGICMRPSHVGDKGSPQCTTCQVSYYILFVTVGQKQLSLIMSLSSRKKKKKNGAVSNPMGSL